jgi:hypothetical protein
MSYKVTAPLVVIANADGTSGDWYGYTDSVVPEGWNDERCKQLVDEGFLVKSDDDGQVKKPAKSASKGEWEAYARSQGATDDDLDGKSKDDLVDAYGG